MRMLFILLILLAFPVLEVVLLIELASRYGWWLLGYLVLSAICGGLLIMEERIVVFGRLIQTLQEGRHPILALLTSAKKNDRRPSADPAWRPERRGGLAAVADSAASISQARRRG